MTPPHCALKLDAGKMTAGPGRRESSIAGRSSNHRSLKQANHHYVKSPDLTDGGRKLSLAGKLKPSDRRDQGMTDFIYLCLSLGACT